MVAAERAGTGPAVTVFELVRQNVTARQAAELYGLRFDRNGRGWCPWHPDGRHAALAFYDRDGGCHCHACHHGGDAIDITGQLLGMTPKEAAEQLRKDFHLDQPVDHRPSPETVKRRREVKDERQRFNKRWSFLCDVVHEADAILEKYTPETIDAQFDKVLRLRSMADLELEILWMEITNYERKRSLGTVQP